jgi:putative ABC transport system permease protein
MTGIVLPVSLRLALRELRGGLAGFYVFIACIALGVGAIAGVSSVSRALVAGLETEGRIIVGGDLAFSLLHQPASEEERAFFETAGQVGEIATTRAMLRRPDDQGQALVELKAVDGGYPHGGELLLEGGGDGQGKLAPQNGMFGVLVAPDVLDRLQIVPGDQVKLGAATMQVRGIIRSEPDRLYTGVGFGPRAIVSLDGLHETGLVRPGSLINWIYRIRMPEGANSLSDIERFRADADARFPEGGWAVRTRDNAAPALRRNIDRFMQFLTLVGLTALVVGGVGVANAVTSFIDLKRPAIAVLKCLGAETRIVFRVYLAQILILAMLGILIGLALGASLPFLAKALLSDIMPVSVGGFRPGELALAALYGLLVTLSFALGPLGRIRRMPASSLFADRAIHAAVGPPVFYRLTQGGVLLTLAALAVLLTRDRNLALLYIGAVVVTFVVLRLMAFAIMAATRRIGALRGTSLRLAVRNIHRPGTLTPSVVLSLGLGLTLLVSLALVDANLRGQLAGSVAERAPDFYFLDVQNAERESFVRLIESTAQGGTVETVPMLRGRIAAVKGVPAAEIKPGEGAAWALRGDRGITYSDSVPANSTLVEGGWWPAGYEGEPLVSVDAEIAGGLDVTVGDTITVNVLGRNVTARIANLREVDWESLSINFVMVFSPNTFRGAPHTTLATLSLPEDGGPNAERAIMAAVTKAFPGATSISVRDALEEVNRLISELTKAVRVAASAALLTSMLVLGGALAAGHRQRRQDAVILKTLGATRPVLLTAFSLEYGLLGLATALFALIAGTAAAWYIVTRVMEMEFTIYPSVAATAVATALAITLGLGLAGTWRILSVKPAALLKNL